MERPTYYPKIASKLRNAHLEDLAKYYAENRRIAKEYEVK